MAMVAVTMLLFFAVLKVNQLLFAALEFTPGINWIYLPAGVRLLATLLFAEAGAIGLLFISWIVCVVEFFPNDPVRSFAGGILASASPYLVYRAMQHFSGLQPSLQNLTPKRLLILSVMFSLASPFLHHLWFALYEHKQDLGASFVAMAAGDLGGTLVVLYFAKFLLWCVERARRAT
ncbi:conserved membrane hypothetical protein [Massilia sp. 9I]|nr:conserved membrane hypothetical protein [Massilia sp. 9I]